MTFAPASAAALAAQAPAMPPPTTRTSVVIDSCSRNEEVMIDAFDGRSDDIGDALDGAVVGHAMLVTTSLGGPAPASMKRKTLLPARCRQDVSQVPPFARRLFRERTAFLSTEEGERLLIRVHAMRTRSPMLREGSRMAE